MMTVVRRISLACILGATLGACFDPGPPDYHYCRGDKDGCDCILVEVSGPDNPGYCAPSCDGPDDSCPVHLNYEANCMPVNKGKYGCALPCISDENCPNGWSCYHAPGNSVAACVPGSSKSST